MSPLSSPRLSIQNLKLAATPPPSPHFPAVTPRAKPSTTFALTSARPPRDGSPSPTMTPSPAMPRGEPVKIISGKRMCRVLEQRGWTLARINGSHHIYRHAAMGRRTVVPVHANQDLKPGTQRGIMRDAGLTDDDL